MKKNCINALKNEVFEILSQVSIDTGVNSYVVGGFVRDYFLGIPNNDIDIVVEGSGINFASCFANKVNGKLSFFENYGTAMVRYNDIEIEFVGARKEMYERGSRKPIVEEGTLYDDISRRDFTINAMAISLNKETYGDLIDYFCGFDDLQNKAIKTPLNPEVTFSDDPLRMFRAVRFVSKLDGFSITPETKKSIKENINRCSILSRERITMEIEKMLSYKKPKEGLLLLNELGLWDFAFPNNKFNAIYIDCVNESQGIDIRWFFLSIEYANDYKQFSHDMKLPKSLCVSLNEIMYTFDEFENIEYPSIEKIRHCLYVSNKEFFNGLYCAFIYNRVIKNWSKEDLYSWYCYTINIANENINFVNFKLAYDGKEIAEIYEISEGKELGALINEIKLEILNGKLSNTKHSIYSYVKHKFLLNKYKK